MQRRNWMLGASAAAIAGAWPVQQAWAQKKYQEGADYVALDKRVPTETTAGKIEVIEFFWYKCPHCNAFEPRLDDWIKALPKDVVLKRMPVAFQDSFVPQQRLFYALDAMGKIPELHKKVFYAIHVEKQNLDTAAAISEWVGKNGVDRKKFDELYNSFAVQTKSRRAAQLQNDYKVGGVPALGIAGRFYVDGALAQNMDRALQITDWLLEEVRKGR